VFTITYQPQDPEEPLLRSVQRQELLFGLQLPCFFLFSSSNTIYCNLFSVTRIAVTASECSQAIILVLWRVQHHTFFFFQYSIKSKLFIVLKKHKIGYKLKGLALNLHFFFPLRQEASNPMAVKSECWESYGNKPNYQTITLFSLCSKARAPYICLIRV